MDQYEYKYCYPHIRNSVNCGIICIPALIALIALIMLSALIALIMLAAVYVVQP